MEVEVVITALVVVTVFEVVLFPVMEAQYRNPGLRTQALGFSESNCKDGFQAVSCSVLIP